MFNKLHLAAQYVLPQHLLSKLAGVIASNRTKWFKQWVIRRFIRQFHVDLNEALIESPDDYANFNSFFTRQLKANARPIVADPRVIISPVDGYLAEWGSIKEDKLIQAKGQYYSLLELFAGNATLANPFREGQFASFYLAPANYHRVHVPFAGELQQTLYIPGKLFSVSLAKQVTIPRIFARNERLACLFNTIIGPMAVFLVGAMLVGGIQTAWGKSPIRFSGLTDYQDQHMYFNKGDQLGFFHMGSAAIVLFAKDAMCWQEHLQQAQSVRLGRGIAKINATRYDLMN